METKKGFVFGACEDATIYYQPNKSQYKTEIDQQDRKWLETVKEAFEMAYELHCKIYTTHRGYARLVVYSKSLYNELTQKRKEYLHILQEPTAYQLGFLQGIFDAEGSVDKKRYFIRVSSQNKKTITVIKTLLKKFGLCIGKPYYVNTVTVLPLYGKENVKKFHKIIDFRHTEKKNRLNELIS